VKRANVDDAIDVERWANRDVLNGIVRSRREPPIELFAGEVALSGAPDAEGVR
jgi:hypothetical protein